MVVVLAALLGLHGVAAGQTSPGGPVGNEGPPNQGISIVAECKKPSQPDVKAKLPVSVAINPATRWQPRGGEVLVEVTSKPEQMRSFTVLACFGWGNAPRETFFSPQNLAETFESQAFARIRPPTNGKLDLINVGVIVPQIGPAPSVFTRWLGRARSAGFGVIPIADMRLIGYNDTGVLFDEVQPIGITSVGFSAVFAVALISLGLYALHRNAVPRNPALPRGFSAAVIRAIRLDWVLDLIRVEDGRASLSSFQMLLWTIVVASGAVYVMALSGELIDLTPGTLVLLGIAGGASLIASTKPDKDPAVAPAQPPPAGPPTRSPVWMDLVRGPRTDLPELPRMQMLLFTVVSAGFVTLQVVSNYVIPPIPEGYLILMGISNGVYVGGKFAPRA